MGKAAVSKSINGILLIDKAAGCTSHDVVHQLRRIFHIKKIGHFGTLDPFATGLLVIGIGEGTKLSPFLLEEDKQYNATIQFGANKDTYDVDGKTTETFSAEGLTKERIESVLQKFSGLIDQIPPQFSAIKIEGKPLYKYAREGQSVEVKPRKVIINSIELLSFNGHDSCDIKVSCSKGTYIRSLAFDIGKILGTGAFLSALRRTASGSFNVSNTVTVKQLENNKNPEKYLLELTKGIENAQIFYANEAIENMLRHGQRVDMSKFVSINNSSSNIIKIINNKHLIAIGNLDSCNFKSQRVFNY